MGGSIQAPRAGLSQPTRLGIAVSYVIGLLFLGLYLNGQIPPPFGLEGLWFYAAFAALVLGEFIIEPFFTRPADALANGVALLFGAASISLAGAEIGVSAASAGRTAYLALGVTVIVVAAIAVAFKDSGGRVARASGIAAFIAGRLGRARVLWSLVLFGVGYAVFADSAGKIAALYLAWIAIFAVGPLERITRLYRRRPLKIKGGVIELIEDPGIAVARFPRETPLKLGAQVTVSGSDVSGVLVDSTTLVEEPVARIAFPSGSEVSLGAELELSAAVDNESTIGHAGDGTTLDALHIETAPHAAASGLEEARLVAVDINDQVVLYQITEAVVTPGREEGFRRDLVRVVGRKLGRWDTASTTFEPVPWIPLPGAPVRLLDRVNDLHFVDDEIGQVPGTSYGIRIDLDHAITHNTAILGILGVGKTHLAWELIQRMLKRGTKVVVLDITGQYSAHFRDICPPEVEQAITTNLNAKIADKLNDRREADGQAGNYRAFQSAIHTLIEEFMDGDERLLILNPSRIEVSRMEGKPFDGRANFMLRLTPVEITQVVAEAILELVHGDLGDEAKVCLVLEEAHSLVPEWGSTVHDAEKQAVNGTTRAILQGRKYGFGCLLITQRTANVTKSILNQCNTIFGLRIYDATGMGFLENYIGPSHARLLAALPDRQAVVFGRASSCNAPIVIGLNDAEQVKARLWEPALSEIPKTNSPDDSIDRDQQPPARVDTAEDDIPF